MLVYGVLGLLALLLVLALLGAPGWALLLVLVVCGGGMTLDVLRDRESPEG